MHARLSFVDMIRSFVCADEVEALPTLVKNVGTMRMFLRGMRSYLWAGLIRR